jgi:hypothetical protein
MGCNTRFLRCFYYVPGAVEILSILVAMIQKRYSHTNSIFFRFSAILDIHAPFFAFCFFVSSVLYVFSVLMHCAPDVVEMLSRLVSVVQNRYSHTNSAFFAFVHFSRCMFRFSYLVSSHALFCARFLRWCIVLLMRLKSCSFWW